MSGDVSQTRSARQLAAIGELVALTDELGLPVWLRGGWAVDFTIGRVTRYHADVDWFATTDRAEELVAGLSMIGFSPAGAAPRDQQIDMVRGDVEHGIVWITRNADGEATVAGGPWAGELWPPGMLGGPVCTLGQTTVRVISVEAQITIKELTPTWQPHLSRRAKDLEDIKLLEQWLKSTHS